VARELSQPPAAVAPRLVDVAHSWREGVRFEIPVCCRSHFCVDRLLGRTVSVVRWRQIARWNTPLVNADPWVPCGIVHSGYSPWRLPRRIVGIVMFQLALCMPGDRSRWMRARATSPGPVWQTLDVETKVAASRSGVNGQMWWARPTHPPGSRPSSLAGAREPEQHR